MFGLFGPCGTWSGGLTDGHLRRRYTGHGQMNHSYFKILFEYITLYLLLPSVQNVILEANMELSHNNS